MDVYEVKPISDRIRGNSYVGRGLVIGKTRDGTKAAAAYFIMGRSQNSRNRIFARQEDGVYTQPFDVSKVEDPSLIIYPAVRRYENHLIVTNGDQTDTVYQGLQAGKSFSQALSTRSFEPDGPNWTPRISGILHFGDGDFEYEESILKSADAEGSACARFTFSYPALAGVGHFLHTYVGDGKPLPTFQGEPERVSIPDEIDEFTDDLWNALDSENKISLYVCYVDLATGRSEERIVNKNGEAK